MKRKVISVLLSLGMISALVTGCSSSSGTEETTSTDTAAEASADTEETADEAADTEETASTGEASATAGVIWYNFADTFIANARQCLNNVAYFFGTGRRFPRMVYYTIPGNRFQGGICSLMSFFMSMIISNQEISAPAGISFSGVTRERFPFSSSAHRSMPSDTRPRIFLGSRFTSTITFLPTISSGE